MAPLRNYLAALGFLTRLGPSMCDPDLAASVPSFPAVGATLGLVLTAPLYLGLLAAHPYAAAWAYALANLALTRGLHYDGFADVADAWGSLAVGDRFFTIMKDSRIGAFGGMALVVAFSGQICLGGALLAAGRLAPLLTAPMLGRAAAIAFMRLTRDLARPGLGSLCLPGATGTKAVVAMAASLVLTLALTGPLATLASLCCCAAVLATLAALARRQGGVNGDFIGAAILGCELASLLGCLLAA